MRAQILAFAVALLPAVTACSIDVHEGGESPQTLGDIAVYPGARRVANLRDDPTDVSFSGSFTDTRVVPETFESDDAPAMVLEFYRAAMRGHTEVVECRGNINIRRTRRIEEPVCIERSSSQIVQLATGTRSYYWLVAVNPRGTATEFTLVSVYAR